MLACYTNIYFHDLHAGAFLRLDNSFFNRANSFVNVGYHTATNAFRSNFANTKNFDAAIFVATANHDTNFCSANVKGYNRFRLVDFSVSHEIKNLLV
jgi:hypothetical protein